MNIYAMIIALLGAWFGHANPVVHIPGAVFLFPAVMLWIGMTASSLRQALQWGWVCGGLCCAASLYWIFIPVHVYGHFHWLLALPCPILVGMYLGLYTALFAALIHWLKVRLPSFLLPVTAGLLWGSMEMAQGTLFTGFSWMTLAVAMAPWPATIQAASIGGEYWLSALFAVCTAWLVLGRTSRLSLFLGIGGFACLLGWGKLVMDTPLPEAPPARVTLIQGNIDQSLKWDDAYQEETIQTYLQLTRKELAPVPDLVVWPETAVPLYLQEENILTRQIRGFVRANRFPLLTGSPRYVIDVATASITYANSAFLLNPDGETVAVYDKHHLVPFGEYVPFGALFPFISRLVHGEGEFIPGTSPAPLRWGNLALGMLICYEAIFPKLSQDRVQAGANLLVNISNDAWFGDSSAPRQHLYQAVLRAVEQGRFLVRATNTGISAVIDPRGRRLESGTLFQQLTLTYPDVRLLDDPTFFHRHYSLIHHALPLAACALLLLALLSRPRQDH